MTNIYQVPESATFEAVRRHLAQVRGGRVALELPEGWLELDSPARVRLLQRQAQMQGAEVALITRHEPTRKAAKQVGVPVFLHPEDADNDKWRMTPELPLVNPAHPDASLPEPPPWRRQEIVKRERMPTHHQARQRRIETEARYRKPAPTWVRLSGPILMGGLIVLALAFFIFYILPAATVILAPGRETVTVTVPLTADANVEASDLEANLLAARLVETNLTLKGTTPTSGTRQKATDKAVGEVVFSNLGAAPLKIPKGTIVSTSSGSPVSFRTTAEVELPGGVGNRINAPIEALKPGIQGNVRANTINTVSGGLRFRVRVTNPNGTYGGGAQLTGVVTKEDQDRLLEDLKARADAQAMEALQAEVEPGEWLAPDSVQTYVIAQVFDQYEDSESDQLDLTLRVLVQGVAVAEEDLAQATVAALEEAIPEDGQLVADSITYQREPGAVASGRTVQFELTASGEYVAPIDPREVRSAIAGLTPEEATVWMETNLLLAGPPDIYQDPQWVRTLPKFPTRIQVRVEYDEALAAE
jgi:hypothetical protein